MEDIHIKLLPKVLDSTKAQSVVEDSGQRLPIHHINQPHHLKKYEVCVGMYLFEFVEHHHPYHENFTKKLDTSSMLRNVRPRLLKR